MKENNSATSIANALVSAGIVKDEYLNMSGKAASWLIIAIQKILNADDEEIEDSVPDFDDADDYDESQYITPNLGSENPEIKEVELSTELNEIRKIMGKITEVFNTVNSSDSTTTPLNGMSNERARKFVAKIARSGYHNGIYNDDFWDGKNGILKALGDAGIDYDLISAQYSPEFPNTWKEWKLKFTFDNDRGIQKEMIGTIIAAGAGSVEQPLDRYDMNFTIY